MAKPLQKGNNPNNSVATMQQHILTSEEMVSLPTEELMAKLKTSQLGLSTEQVTERLEVYGRNELAREHKHSALKEFLMHFKIP